MPGNPISSATHLTGTQPAPRNAGATGDANDAPPSRMTREDVIRAYGRYAPLYDAMFGAVCEPGRRRLADAVASLAPSTILEVGVGTGLTLGRYPQASAVTGIDLSDAMLLRARNRSDRLHRNITLRTMDAEAMDFPDASFECVTLPYVLSTTPDPDRLVAELRRVCKLGGHILILNHFSGSRFWWLLERAVRPLAGKIGFRSDFRFDDQILRHDWTVESVQAVNLFGLSRLVVLRNG